MRGVHLACCRPAGVKPLLVAETVDAACFDAAAIEDAEAERDEFGWEEAEEQELQMMGSCLQAMRRRDAALEFEDWDECDMVMATAWGRIEELQYRKRMVLEQDE